MTVVVVDDNPLVHKVWKDRFSHLELKDSTLQFLYANDLKTAKKFVSSLEKNGKDYILLIDNDLKNSELSGIEFVEQMKVQTKSILVTSDGI